MLTFIANVASRILGFVGGTWQTAINSVVTSFRDLFTAFHGYWHTVASNAISGWQELTRDILLFEQGLQRFLLSQYATNVLVIKRLIPNVVKSVTQLGATTRVNLAAEVKILERDITTGDAAQHAYSQSILAWVLVHVLAFLLTKVVTLILWIAGIGSTMWHYFTNLDEFALLLFWHIITTLETLAWDAGARLGRFFLSLIVHNVVRFATLVESIVDAII